MTTKKTTTAKKTTKKRKVVRTLGGKESKHDAIKREFYTQLKEKGFEAYARLPEQEQDWHDKHFFDWWYEKEPLMSILIGRDYPLCIKQMYLAEALLSKEENDFDVWFAKQPASKKTSSPER